MVWRFNALKSLFVRSKTPGAASNTEDCLRPASSPSGGYFRTESLFSLANFKRRLASNMGAAGPVDISPLNKEVLANKPGLLCIVIGECVGPFSMVSSLIFWYFSWLTTQVPSVSRDMSAPQYSNDSSCCHVLKLNIVLISVSMCWCVSDWSSNSIQNQARVEQVLAPTKFAKPGNWPRGTIALGRQAGHILVCAKTSGCQSLRQVVLGRQLEVSPKASSLEVVLVKKAVETSADQLVQPKQLLRLRSFSDFALVLLDFLRLFVFDRVDGRVVRHVRSCPSPFWFRHSTGNGHRVIPVQVPDWMKLDSWRSWLPVRCTVVRTSSKRSRGSGRCCNSCLARS